MINHEPAILHLLLLDEGASYDLALSEALALERDTVDLTRVESLEALDNHLKSSSWDAVIASHAMGSAALKRLQADNRAIPLILLCQDEDAETAFSLIESGITDILPMGLLKRLPLILRREQELRALRHREADHAAQKHLVESLKRSEMRFRTVIEGFNDVIVMVDAFQVIRYANRALERDLGYSTADVLGRPLSILLHPDENITIAMTLAGILETAQSSHTVEHRLRRADGEWEIAETTGQSNTDPAGQPMVMLHIHLITSRKKSEIALKESEQRFQRMADTAPAMLWVTDSAGACTFLSRGWYEFTHQKEEAARGTGWLDAVHPEDRERTEAVFRQANETGTMFQVDYRLRRFDGQYRWAVDSGRPNFSESGDFIGYIGSVIDIHERKDAEQALRRSEMRYRSVIEDQIELICRHDSNLVVTFANRAYSEMFGIENPIGVSLLDYLSPTEHERAYSDLDALTPANPMITTEYETLMPDGTTRWIQWTSRVLLDENNHALEYQAVGRDITQRRQAEKELEALYNATSYLFKADSLLNLGHQIVDAVVKEFEQADCGLLLVDKPQNKIVRLARTGKYKIHPETPLAVNGLGLVPLTVRTGRAVYVPDVSLDANYIPSEAQTRSELVIPLKTVNGVIAVLDLQRSELNAFSERDQRILTAYAERAAAAIENMQLYEQINRYALELELRVTQRTFQLNEAKDRVEAILNNNPDGIALTDMDLEIQKTNFAFDRLFDCDSDTCIGKPLTALIHSDDATLVRMMVRAVTMEQKGQTVAVRAQRRDGSIFYVELSIGYVGIADTEEAGLVCIVHDVTDRRLAEQALDESHRFTRQITETTPNVIYIYDIQDQKTIYVNRNPSLMMGYDLYDFPDSTKHPMLRIMHPDDAARYPRYMQQIMTSKEDGVWQFEYRVLHKTEEWRWFLSRTTVFRRDDKGNVSQILATATDITERKQAEESLRESEEKFRLLMEAAPVAVVITDQSGHIALINIQAEILFGYNRDDLLDQPIEILIPERVHQAHRHHMVGYIKAPQTKRMGMRQELFARRKDGTEVPVEIELSYVDTQAGLLVMAFVVDITERKERERQLRYHASLQENVTDAVIATDLNFYIQSWNRAAESIYGWSKEEVLGKPVSSILNTTYMNESVEARITKEFLEHGYWTDEVIQYHRTGSIINLLSSVVLFKDESDRPIGIVAVNHDITNRKKAEQAVHQALVKEKELSELKTRFISMASHEFRTPLASILALTETLMAYRHKLSEDQIDQRFGKIKEQVDYLKDIMEDVLLLGRMQTRRVEFNPDLVDIHALCRSVLEEFQSHPSVPHQLVYVTQGPARDVSVDKKLMRHVINNLVGNAIKYSPDSKPIIVTLTIMDTSLILEVRDEGIGIPDFDLKHLFEPFHRAANVGTISGTGLGLVITKEAVDFHSGTITADSQEGVGTTFTVMIPLTLS